ncbi:hypothetical protein DFQ01_13085 [Paenibacillus cellulosilyticus]|uniref:DUF4829 domain-containing protein n=1 Tax=Paenibacillus cellulosilyticus TaxID=375489 RepID=A0A2V2YLK6_9BACL|nr:hypothetical protein [Paenibacillus cellulosilyticus]PWV94520.1 hypothetical protein DFQ01_13085 [Paenibacillus cellulosilyticus]QKS45027.1 hypothetical protein HUB94_11840 [Paenibacillus cellulosilyticus]
MNRKRRKIRIFIAGLVVLLLVYIAIDVRMIASVKSTIRTLYLHPDQDQTMIDDYRVTDDALRKFFRRGAYPLSKDEDAVQFRLSIGSGFHSFVRGTVWVNYTFVGIDPDTGLSSYGSSNVPIRLKVKLHHWQWQIIDKHEEA